jgi:hypothetical protein
MPRAVRNGAFRQAVPILPKPRRNPLLPRLPLKKKKKAVTKKKKAQTRRLNYGGAFERF